MWFSVPIIYLSCYQKMTWLCCLVIKLNTLLKKIRTIEKISNGPTHIHTLLLDSLLAKKLFPNLLRWLFSTNKTNQKIQKPVIKNFLLHLQQEDIKGFYNILQSSQLPSGMCHIIMSMSYSFLHPQCPTYSWSHMYGLSTEVYVNMK